MLQEQKGRTQQPASTSRSSFLDMPWLEHLDTTFGFSDLPGKEDAGAASSRAADVTKLLEISEDDLLAGLSDLEKARCAAVAEHSARGGGGDFAPKIRGGASQILKSGEVAHAAQGQTTNAVAKKWAQDNRLQVTFKATFGTHGVDAANTIVRGWCHRMQFFYDMHMANADDASFAFTAREVGLYAEPSDLTALASELTNIEWQGRIAAIRLIPFK